MGTITTLPGGCRARFQPLQASMPTAPPDEPAIRSANPWCGQVIDGRYTVEHVLGTGGMGTVLAARHNILGHLAAIKIMHPELAADPTLVKRFIQEGQAVVRVRSEHVVRVSDVGMHGVVPFLVMELLEGMDLGSWLERYGPLPLEAALDWFLQAAEAISEAHHAGIVHRDIKPANLFVATGPSDITVIKVLDFGIAQLAGASPSHRTTQAAIVMGSPEYMSPEQMNGALDLDERTDIWALGCVLYEMLTARPLWGFGSEAAVMTAILRKPPPSVREHDPQLPARVDQVIHTCLAKDRNQRYAGVADLMMALAPVTQSLGITGQPRNRRPRRSGIRPWFERTIVGMPASPSSDTPPPQGLEQPQSIPDPIEVSALDTRAAAFSSRFGLVLLLAAGALALTIGAASLLHAGTAATPASERIGIGASTGVLDSTPR